MTVLEALNWAQTQLKQTASEKILGEANPMVDAQILLAYTLGKPTSYLFGHFDDTLPEIVTTNFQRLVERRRRHEPIAYVIGEKEFYGRPLRVNENVLIPRPETEGLVELALKHMTDATTFIDVGTGSGAIAVTLAAESFQPVVATEMSSEALQVAKHNADLHEVAHQISFLQGNLLEPYFQTGVKLGENDHVLILANLPYLPDNHWHWLDPDVNHYEPQQALTAGVDGLDAYDKLLQQLVAARKQLPERCELACEIDPSQASHLPALARSYFPQAETQILKDLSGRSRIAHIQL